MSQSYFGRVEPDGRRHLGSDFQHLAKWTTAFAMNKPPLVPLSKLSPSDQATLFSKLPRQFCLQKGPDNTFKLQTVKDEPVSWEKFSKSIDPDVAATLHTSTYERAQSRQAELEQGAINAEPALVLYERFCEETALHEGKDAKAAFKKGKEGRADILNAILNDVKTRWKQEFKDTWKLRLEQALSAQGALNVKPDIKVNGEAIKSKLSETVGKIPTNAIHNAKHYAKPDIKIGDNTIDSKSSEAFLNLPTDVNHNAELGTNDQSEGSEQDSDDEESEYFDDDSDEDSNEESAEGSGQENADHVVNFPTAPDVKGANINTLPALSPDHGSDTTNPGSSGSPSTERSSPQFPGADGTAKVNGQLGYSIGQPQFTYLGVPPYLAYAFNASNGIFDSSNFIAPPNMAGQLNTSFAVNQTGSATCYNPYANAYSTNIPPQPFYNSIVGTQTVTQTTSTVVESKPIPCKPAHQTVEEPEIRPGEKYPRAKKAPFPGMDFFDVPWKGRPEELVPEYWAYKDTKLMYLWHKIHDFVLLDAKLRTTPATGLISRNPIHVFVDLSNIIIGFYDSMKIHRRIPVQRRVPPPAFAFDHFDTLLTRNREVAKRVVAGSLGNNMKKKPEYMVKAQELGYEMNIMQRVPKPISPLLKKKSLGGSPGVSDTSGDDLFAGPMKQGEQGVDEILHLKILQSITDFPGKFRGTIVLATGDAAHAEYSDGFKRNIERALSHGWNIELYGWSRNISSAWRDPAFSKLWNDQFRIVELDSFSEELYDLTIDFLED
ncbi:hypothetical protein B0T26DRAFT_370882 [Lasiosphaeria miniovina]|uniref:NYN domain-containing protein n=1 Tax=Lasiosphaeria miniovina TaxID=1954250 RepID=A0AA40DRS2_9PEZI|nr:uncharacterized protein B0T26DRAFT_370882 [Lasiosphaeria miniovina]KAK0713779.1 hypothetical protein B0T26DRAFT_370882 [Lasiosphaeria miniovina]